MFIAQVLVGPSKQLKQIIHVNGCEWAETWPLNFNISRCSHLGITNKVVPLSHNYLMNDIVIAKSACTKYLGVTISHNLNWNQHCDNICSKANSMLGLLRRVLSDCSMTQ